jgi:hypothetical protein
MTGIEGRGARVPRGMLGIALLCAALAGLGDRALAGPPRVDLALVLAIDVSKSISAEEHRLQVDGYAEAFRDRAVLGAIADGANGAIVVTVLEWANTRSPLQAIGWTLVKDRASAESLAAAIEVLPYRGLKGTSIGSAIDFSHRLLDVAPCIPTRRVIDISGDGKSMHAVRLASARASAIGEEVTINGLPIGGTDAGLADYYGKAVIGGAGAFLVVAEGFADFDSAVLRKLVLEIAGREPAPTLRFAAN